MTMTTAATDMQIVPMTCSTAEVRLHASGSVVSIGRVGAQGDRWYWQHRDGEQSSPIAGSRTEAATALAEYHKAFKPQRVAATPGAATAAAGAPVRRLLFG